MYKRLRPKGAKLSERKFRELIKCFSLDLTAKDASVLVRLNRHTVNKYYECFRQLILKECGYREHIEGSVEVDESYFGPRRIRGKRGRGAGKKIIVFGILKREGRVYTHIIKDCRMPTIVPLIDGQVSKGSKVYSDDLGTYRHLYLRYNHQVVFHGRNEFAKKDNHINGIESFWAFAKHRMIKFKGIRKDRFLIYLKESEWRFNHRHEDLYKTLIKLLNKYS